MYRKQSEDVMTMHGEHVTGAQTLNAALERIYLRLYEENLALGSFCPRLRTPHLH